MTSVGQTREERSTREHTKLTRGGRNIESHDQRWTEESRAKKEGTEETITNSEGTHQIEERNDKLKTT